MAFTAPHATMPPPTSMVQAAAFESSPVFALQQSPSTTQPVNKWNAAKRHPFRWPPQLSCTHQLLRAQRLFLSQADNDLCCQKLPRRGVVCSVGQQQPRPLPQPQLASTDGADANAPAFPTIPAHVHTITSPANAYIRHCVQVRQSRSYRDAANSVLVVGGTPLR